MTRPDFIRAGRGGDRHRRAAAACSWLALALAAPLALAVPPTVSWIDSHDGGGRFNDDGWCTLSDATGDLIVAGESADGLGGIDLCVRRLSRLDGQRLWEARYQGYDGKDVTVADVTWATAGQLLVAGYIRGCVG